MKILQETYNAFNHYIVSLIQEGLSMKLTQKDLEMKDAFKQMNKQIYGDKTSQEKKDLQKQYTDRFRYKSQTGHITQPPIKPSIEGEVFTFGNAKLASDVLIINLTSAMHCPSKQFCAVPTQCYAQRDEWRGKQNRARNGRNEMMFDMARENPAKWNYIFWFIKKYIETAKTMGLEVHHIRLNESGDFKTSEDIRRFDEFAKEIKEKYGIETHCYTANVALKNDIAKIQNINVNASLPSIQGQNVFRHFYCISDKKINNMEDTELIDIATPRLKQSQEYGLYYKCPCDIADGETCRNCKVCWYAKPGYDDQNNEVKYFSVLCAYHGQGQLNVNFAQKKRGIIDKEEQLLNIKKMQKVARKSEKKKKAND